MTNEQFLAQLRGARDAEEPGARGIERVARNPECTRLRALTIAGLTPATAALILGVPAKEGQSPLAIAMGRRFEKHMFDNGAANLFALYRKEGLLGVNESKFVAIDELAPIHPNMPKQQLARALQVREAETRALLDAKRRGAANAPNIIQKPRLFVKLVDLPHAVEPDYLVAADDEPAYRVGELKSYADRGGKTDQSDIRSACRQAAVGIVALRQAAHEAGVAAPAHLSPFEADLVLRVTGLFMPSFSRMSVAGEIDSIERAIREAPTNLAEMAAMLPPGATFADPATLVSVPNNYRSSCKEYCALWEHCRAQAHEQRRPIILGEQAAEMLAAAGSIDRALELMRGQGTPPRNSAEAALAEELRVAGEILQRAAGHG